MFLATLTVVTQLQLRQPNGIALDNSTAHITEPADIQPALGRNFYQRTLVVQDYQPARVFGLYQPADRAGRYQRTFNPQQALGE